MSQQQGEGFPGHSPCLCFHLSISPRCPETRHFTEPLGGCTSGDPSCTQMWVVQFVLTPTYTLSYNSGPQGVNFSNNWPSTPSAEMILVQSPPNDQTYLPAVVSPIDQAILLRENGTITLKQFVVAGHAYHAARFYIPHATGIHLKKGGPSTHCLTDTAAVSSTLHLFLSSALATSRFQPLALRRFDIFFTGLVGLCWGGREWLCWLNYAIVMYIEYCIVLTCLFKTPAYVEVRDEL